MSALRPKESVIQPGTACHEALENRRSQPLATALLPRSLALELSSPYLQSVYYKQEKGKKNISGKSRQAEIKAKKTSQDFLGEELLGPQASLRVISCSQTQISTYPGRGYSAPKPV